MVDDTPARVQPPRAADAPLTPWYSYMAGRPPLPPLELLHGEGGYLGLDELAELVGPAAAARLHAARSAVQLGELCYLLHALVAGGGR